MAKKILVPLDGSGLADRILTLAKPILVQEDTEVVLLRILTDGVAPESEEGKRALAHLERLRDALSLEGGRARCEVVPGKDPAEAILAYAGELGPSLIVTSTHGRSSSLRWIRGSVAERILQKTEHPVLLANPASLGGAGPARPLSVKNILVPLDGSELAAKILPLVSNVARLWGAEIVLLHVIDPNAKVHFGTDQAAVDALLKKHGSKELDRLRVRTTIAHGTPAVAILEAVDEIKPDVVALTTHGQGGASPWAFGSVAEQVLRNCAKPLLVNRTSGFSSGRK